MSATKKLAIFVIVGIALAGTVFLFMKASESRDAAPGTVTDAQSGRTFRWEERAPMPVSRTGAAAAALGGKIYVVGGMNAEGGTTANVYIYDPATDSWSTAPPLPEPRHHAAAAVIGDTLYVIGGFTGFVIEPHNDVFAFNKESGTWEEKDSLDVQRGALVASVWQDRIYAAGGVGRGGTLGTLSVYDALRDEWTPLEASQNKRDHLAGAVIGGILYLAGGREGTIARSVDFFESYDTRLRTWRTASAIGAPRSDLAGAMSDGLFIVAGGESSSGVSGDVEAFDPHKGKEGSWIMLPPLPTPRHGLSAASSGDNVYFIGGGTAAGLSVSGVNEVLVIE